MQASYREYVADDKMLGRYAAYQRRYADTIRESDRIILEAVGREIARGVRGDRPRALDVGCSTGNLLGHLHRAFPDVELHGADLAEHSIGLCRRDPDLQSIALHVMDMTEGIGEEEYDVIIANAVTLFLDPEQYVAALRSVAAALKPDGLYIAYEFLHPFCQELDISERSRSHPQGLRFYYRSFARAQEASDAAGLRIAAIRPFEIPIDLAKGQTYSSNEDGFEDLNTYTRHLAEGGRIMFRGALSQPWCHFYARRRDSAVLAAP